MSWTKREFVTQAFQQIGLASYVFDLTPDQLESALRMLDSMMGMWNAKGIRLGYPLPVNPGDSDLDDLTTVPDSATEAIYTNLGIRLAPTYGKQVMPETKALAKQSFDVLLARAAMPMEMQLDDLSVPRGAGSKDHDAPFIDAPTEPLLTGDDGELELLP